MSIWERWTDWILTGHRHPDEILMVSLVFPGEYWNISLRHAANFITHSFIIAPSYTYMQIVRSCYVALDLPATYIVLIVLCTFLYCLILNHSSVSIWTGLQAGRGKRFLSSPKCADQLCGPCNLLHNGYMWFFPWGWSSWGMELITLTFT